MSSGFLDSQGFVNTSAIERDWNARGGSEATRGEFETFMSEYGFSAEDSGTIFDQFDVNTDGALSTAEFLDGLDGTNMNDRGGISAEEFEASTGVEIPDEDESCDDDPCCEPDPCDPPPSCGSRDEDGDDGDDSSYPGLFDRDGAMDMDAAGRLFESEASEEATANEFNDVLDKIGIDVDDRDAVFDMFDINGDGAVSRSEFLDGLYAADRNDNDWIIREELDAHFNS